MVYGQTNLRDIRFIRDIRGCKIVNHKSLCVIRARY